MNKFLTLVLAVTAAIAAIATTGYTGNNGDQRHPVLVPSPLGSTTYDGSRHPADACLHGVLEDSAIGCPMHADACGPDELNLQTSFKNVLVGVPCASVCSTCWRDGGICIHVGRDRCLCA